MKRWLGSRTALALAFALSMVLGGLSLGIGFVTDDEGFRAMLHSSSDKAPAVWDLFRFQRGDAVENAAMIRYGHLPWWSAPDLRIHFLRPLASLSFAADDRVFGGSPLGYHLDSLAWLTLLLAGVAMLYRRLLPPAAATLGLALFGLAAAHTEAYAWLSARHALVGGAGAAWALALVARGGKARWFAPVVFAIGLAGSESALGAAPIWMALAWADEGSRRTRLLRCLPPVVVGMAYIAGYAALHCGTRASGGYHDPMTDPAGFLGVAVTRIPALLGDAALAVPVELAFVRSPAALAVVGLAATALVALAAWATRTPPAKTEPTPTLARASDRLLAVLALAGLVACIPGAAGFPTGRVLVVPDLAFAAVLGAILARAFDGSSFGKVLAGVIAFAHFVFSPLVALHDLRSLARRGHAVDRVAEEIAAMVPNGGRAFVVTASDPLVYLYPRGVLAMTAPHAVSCWSILSAARSGHRLTRTDAHSFELEALDRPPLDGFDTLFRAPDRPFAVDDTVEQCGATIRVAAVRDGRPTKLEVKFERRLDDPKLTFLVWQGGELARLDWDSVGDGIEIPWSPGPSGVF